MKIMKNTYGKKVGHMTIAKPYYYTMLAMQQVMTYRIYKTLKCVEKIIKIKHNVRHTYS